MLKFLELLQIAVEFSTEEACLDHLEKVRWPDGVRCLKEGCGSGRITKLSIKEGQRRNGRKIPARHLYQCRECGYQFTARTGTLFNDSHLPLTKWFLAVALMTNANKGLSAKQLQRDLNVSYETAWYLCHRIQESMRIRASLST
jgi:transposase-like protein